MHDPPEEASFRVKEYWEKLAHLPCYHDLNLREPENTVPISWHCDGVKVYKTQKCWVYSFASCIRKGPSLESKMMFMLFRENEHVKGKTHDSVARLIAYSMRVMMTGLFPAKDCDGNPWPEGSPQARRSNTPFAGEWKFAFSTFKADLEARVACHKLVRNYASNSICEHCLASKLDNGFQYGDFSDRAAYLECMFTHEQFVLLNPPDKQSVWLDVPGWHKDRNVDAPRHA